ncbi:cation:proton antiporter [Ehrlichia sp. JZT12]
MVKCINYYSIMSFLSFPYFITLFILELLLHDSVSDTYNYIPLLFFVFSFIIVLIFLYIGNIKKHETILYLLYYLSSVCAISLEDLPFVIIAFEVMALSAIMIIASESCGINQKSVIHYSCIHFLAGVLLLIGMSGETLNMINIFSMEYNNYYKLFILVGILINCACLPLSSWVPDAYSSTSHHSIIVLSVFTTKVSAFILLCFFQGEKILLFLGIATSIYGIVFSILENSIKRLLCYNLVGQMGLVITAIGFSYNIGTDIRGIIVLQLILSIAYQTLLFMVAISVINSTKKFNISEVGKLFTKMPIEAIGSIVAILNMGAFPGTGGFVSKFLITHSVNNADFTNVLISKLFLGCSILLFVSVGVKFFWFTFISKVVDNSIIKKVNLGSRISILTLTVILLYFGILGHYSLFDKLSRTELHSAVLQCVLQCGLVFGGVLFFICFRSVFRGRINFEMDIDWIYRVLFMRIISLANDFLLCVHSILVTILSNTLSKSTLLYSKANEKVMSISNVSSLGLTIMLAMSFIIIMVIVYLCLNL